MQEIAEHAGVTRALLYHYFATKAELFGGIWSRAHQQVRTRPASPAPTARAWLEQLLRDYLDFYAANLPLVVAANRSSISADPAVRRPVDQAFRQVADSLLGAVAVDGHDRAAAEVAFAGWIAFVRESSLSTYLDKRISPDENLALCMVVFDAAVGRHANFDTPPPANAGGDSSNRHSGATSN
ncbi:TetR/AcrR family transcriptional regulator [Gordonia humi]|uniref:AcrR family transcriptional regulator n=1 Tax=Gordonia humi TaxID=686429 RepID=A0A840F1B6_9ACTN|nr:AcrR family transcriptional regulator [Gordonia humi]